MTNVYGTIEDIRAVGYPLPAAQEKAAGVLLEQASARLRQTARRFGKDIDALIADAETGKDYELSVKSVVVQAVCRGLDSVANSGDGGTALAQGTQSLGAYSVSMTYLNAGQSLYFLRSELKDLGLYRTQTFGALDLYRGCNDDISDK